MIDINSTVAIISLNMNPLSTPIKRWRLSEYGKENYMWSIRKPRAI